MRVPFIDIAAQHHELASEIEPAVLAVLSSGSYVMGPNHDALEREIATRHGCRFGIGLNSGTDALRIMLDAAGIGPGDEVITGAFTFVASAETIVQTGSKPVFVDVDPETLMIDPAKVEAALTPKTKAIMPIHLFGQLADVTSIAEIAALAGVPVLEDAAQAIDAAHEGRYAGKFGLSAGVSFYVTKNLGAAGDGGMILTDDEEHAQLCRSIRVHGMGRERYKYDHLGYTSRLDEVQAAVLRVKLTKLTEWTVARRRLAAGYLEGLAAVDIRLPKTSCGNNHTWHQFTIQTERRDELKEHLRGKGIDSMIYYPIPLHFHAPYAHFGQGEGSLPETERASREVLSLPIHQYMTDEQVSYVVEAIQEFFG